MKESTVVSTDARWRGEVYGLLSLACHRPPAADEAGRAAACAATARELGREGIAAALEALAVHARDEDASAVKQDFNDLFMVPGPKYLAPYESVFADAPIEAGGKANPRTYGRSTIAVMSFYGKIGLQVARTYTELPDYAGLEFACMEYLCSRESGYSGEGNETAARNAKAMQCLFLRDHLRNWIPAFAGKLRDRAGTETYRALADLARAWTLEESEPCSEA